MSYLPTYQIKPDEMLYSLKKELSRYDKRLHIWITLNLYVSKTC